MPIILPIHSTILSNTSRDFFFFYGTLYERIKLYSTQFNLINITPTKNNKKKKKTGINITTSIVTTKTL